MACHLQLEKGMATERETGIASAQERRQWARLPIAVPMFVRGRDQRDKPFVDFATALNISAGGALLVSKRGLKAGAELVLEIPVGVLPEALMPKLVRQIKARLLRAEPANGCFLVGVEFADPLPI
jgi:hypothetical protein